MERFIKYKRIEKKLTLPALQLFFDELITDGFEIIYYNEKKDEINDVEDNSEINVVIVAGKKQIDLKSVL
jgi:predicted nucleic acid-binding protein